MFRVKCNQCGSSNTKDAVFCNRCGAKLGFFCLNCGIEVEKEDEFCKKCGNALDQAKKENHSGTQTAPVLETSSPPSTRKRKKIPVWLLIVLGVIVVICSLTAVFGGFSFSIGGPATTETSTILSATITAIIVPTATPKITPTIAPTPTPSYDIGEFDFLCAEDQAVQYLHEHQHISVSSFIAALEEDMDPYFQEFMEKAIFSVIFDGEQIAPLIKYYDKPIYDAEFGLFKLIWGFEADPLPVGMHTSESTLSFSEPMQIPESQGGNLIGPGTDENYWSFYCPLLIGAPDASWQVVAQSDFSEAKGFFKNVQTQDDYLKFDERESVNGVYRLHYETINYAEGDTSMIYRELQNFTAARDVIITFDANVTKTAEDAEYGLVVRKSEKADTGYYLEINPCSQQVNFRVAYSASESVSLFSEQSPAVLQDTKNEITFLAQGDTFILWVNRKMIFFIEDSIIQEAGKVGVTVRLIGEGETEFKIDNLLVRAPVN
jgi:hypothetical protein